MEKHNQIVLTIDNQFCIHTKDSEQIYFDFNHYYNGYYPSCRFTAVGYGDSLFYGSGTDDKGIPHLFSSGNGKVWSPVNIVSRLRLVKASEYGDIIRILYDEDSHQPFLVTQNGFLVALPDCPKCVRAHRVSDRALIDGRIDGDKICLEDCDGKRISFFLSSEIIYRCAWSYAQPHIGKDGILVDLRESVEAKENPISGALIYPAEKLDDLLKKYPKELYLFFVCERGSKSDDAVREARERGFEKAYSLGGTGELLIDCEGELP